jgi:hypothetical protein
MPRISARLLGVQSDDDTVPKPGPAGLVDGDRRSPSLAGADDAERTDETWADDDSEGPDEFDEAWADDDSDGPDEFDEADFADPDPTLVPRPPVRRRTGAGTMLGAAMLGLREVLYGKVKEDSVIEIESSGDPPNIDIDGLDELFGDDQRLVAPPLDQIRARGRHRRANRRR